MDPLRWNKIFAAVLIGALTIMVMSTVSESIFHTEHGQLAFNIEVPETGAATAEVVEEGPSLAALLAGASVEKGARQFAKCRACHTTDKGGRNGTGPNLYGILGRAVASVAGFKYSSAVSSHGGEWNYELLDAWLKNPKATIAGNSMSFAGIRKPEQRADLIAYLRSFADSPLPLPVEEVVEEVAPVAEEVAATVEGASE